MKISMKRHMSALKVLGFLVVLLPALPGAAAASSTVALVERFHTTLLSVMKEAKSLGLKGRFERLKPEMENAFDLTLMIRIATGSYWREASPDQREKLLSAFKKMSIGTYASQFDGYSGEAFETVEERPGPQKTLLVETRILRPNKEPVGITYVMRKRKDRWRISDVLLDNSISELAVRRSEYRLVLKNSGVEGLVSTLNGKTAAMAVE